MLIEGMVDVVLFAILNQLSDMKQNQYQGNL